MSISRLFLFGLLVVLGAGSARAEPCSSDTQEPGELLLNARELAAADPVLALRCLRRYQRNFQPWEFKFREAQRRIDALKPRVGRLEVIAADLDQPDRPIERAQLWVENERVQTFREEGRDVLDLLPGSHWLSVSWEVEPGDLRWWSGPVKMKPGVLTRLQCTLTNPLIDRLAFSVGGRFLLALGSNAQDGDGGALLGVRAAAFGEVLLGMEMRWPLTQRAFGDLLVLAPILVSADRSTIGTGIGLGGRWTLRLWTSARQTALELGPSVAVSLAYLHGPGDLGPSKDMKTTGPVTCFTETCWVPAFRLHPSLDFIGRFGPKHELRLSVGLETGAISSRLLPFRFTVGWGYARRF